MYDECALEVEERPEGDFVAFINGDFRRRGTGWTAGAAVHEVLRIHGGDSGFDFNRFRFEGRWNDIMVYLDGNRDLAGCGKTRGEAVLDAVMAHGSSVGISVAMPQSAAEPAHESSSPLPSGR